MLTPDALPAEADVVRVTVGGRSHQVVMSRADAQDLLALLTRLAARPADEPDAVEMTDAVDLSVGLTTEQAASVCGCGVVAFRELAAQQPLSPRIDTGPDRHPRWDPVAVLAMSAGGLTSDAGAAERLDYSARAFESWAESHDPDLRLHDIPEGWSPEQPLWDAHLVRVWTERPGLSLTEAAAVVGVRPSAFRAWQAQRPDLRLPADQWADRRAPLWDPVKIAAATEPVERGSVGDASITLPTQMSLDPLIWHLAGLGLAAICEQAGHSVRYGWADGESRIDGVDWDEAGRAVANHAAAMARPNSWLRETVDVAGKPVHVMGARWPIPDEPADLVEILARRSSVLDLIRHDDLSVRMVAGLGLSPLPYLLWSDDECVVDLDQDALIGLDRALADPLTRDRTRDALNAQWSLERIRQPNTPAGVNPWDMTPRQRGMSIIPDRLIPLSESVANRTVPQIVAALRDREVVRRPVVNPRMTGWTWQDDDVDDAVTWCALWALSMMPPEQRDEPVDIWHDLTRGLLPRPLVPGHIERAWPGPGFRGWLHLPI